MDRFESERLRMRSLRVDDADALFAAFSDTDLVRYWSSGPHRDVAETRAYIAARIDSADWRTWVMTLPEDDVAIGTLAAGGRRAGVAEVGYMLTRAAWGRGYAREAVGRLIDLLVREEGHRRICADTDPDNMASNRLLESLGFTREGYLREEWETHIGVRDSYIWGLLAREWTNR